MRKFLERERLRKSHEADNLSAEKIENTKRAAEIKARLEARGFPEDYKEGIPNNALTVGDLVDILDLYLLTTESLANKDAVRKIKRDSINAANIEIGLDNWEEARKAVLDIQKLPQDPVMGGYELTHYPGGLKLHRRIHGSDKYIFRATMRQVNPDTNEWNKEMDFVRSLSDTNLAVKY